MPLSVHALGHDDLISRFRPTAAAELSARAAQVAVAHQLAEFREYWISELKDTIRANLKGKSSPPASAQPVAQLLERLPDALRAEERRLAELAYNRATTKRGFRGFWQELEGVRGRSGLADRQVAHK